MQIAEILSDLTSLRVCDYDAAIALVTSHKTISSQSTSAQQGASATPSRPSVSRRTSVLEDEKDDPDLQRALDLVDLHYGVKGKHMQGLDMGLQKARRNVQRAMEGFRTETNTENRRRRDIADPRFP